MMLVRKESGPTMEARTHEATRKQTGQRRIPPLRPQRIFFESGGLGDCAVEEIQPAGPLELYIEATDAHGVLVPWLTDEWWIEIQRLCGSRPVTVILLPTPNALLNSVVLHQLEMIRRIAPHWHSVGYARAVEVQREPNLERWIRTPYEEIRICEDGVPRQPLNGAISAARELATQASSLPRMPGCRYAQIRVIPSFPEPLRPRRTGAHPPNPPSTLPAPAAAASPD